MQVGDLVMRKIQIGNREVVWKGLVGVLTNQPKLREFRKKFPHLPRQYCGRHGWSVLWCDGTESYHPESRLEAV